MLNHPTIDQLRALRLDGMADAFVELQSQDAARDLTPAEWLALLLDRETANRGTQRFKSRLRNAKLRVENAHGQVRQMGRFLQVCPDAAVQLTACVGRSGLRPRGHHEGCLVARFQCKTAHLGGLLCAHAGVNCAKRRNRRGPSSGSLRCSSSGE